MDYKDEDYDIYGTMADTRHKMKGKKCEERKMVKKSHNAKYLREINAALDKRAQQSEESKKAYYSKAFSVGDVVDSCK